jgi:hypothetical protein
MDLLPSDILRLIFAHRVDLLTCPPDPLNAMLGLQVDQPLFIRGRLICKRIHDIVEPLYREYAITKPPTPPELRQHKAVISTPIIQWHPCKDEIVIVIRDRPYTCFNNVNVRVGWTNMWIWDDGLTQDRKLPGVIDFASMMRIYAQRSRAVGETVRTRSIAELRSKRDELFRWYEEIPNMYHAIAPFLYIYPTALALDIGQVNAMMRDLIARFHERKAIKPIDREWCNEVIEGTKWLYQEVEDRLAELNPSSARRCY